MMRSVRWVSIGLGLALLPAVALASPDTHATIIQLSPPSKWHITKSEPLSLSQLSPWGAIPAVDAEYGAKAADLRTYARNGTQIQAIVEEASDPSAAFGLLTFYQTEDMRPVPGVGLALSRPGMALMARNAAFIRVPGGAANSASQADLISFLRSIGGPRPSVHSMDLMPASLPTVGMTPGSEKYLLGPESARLAIPWIATGLFGFSQGAEVHSATYDRSGGRVTLILISYPTPQIAQLRIRAMQKQLDLSRPGQVGQMFGRQDGCFVFLVKRAGPATSSEAVALMNELTVKKIVTVDQKYPGKPFGVQVLELFVANIILILFLAGLAIVGGVLMVIGRRLLAKWFPHAEWAHGGEGSLIQLHLEGR